MHLLFFFLPAAALATAVIAITFQTWQIKDFDNCKAHMKINLGECCLLLHCLVVQKLCLLNVLQTNPGIPTIILGRSMPIRASTAIFRSNFLRGVHVAKWSANRQLDWCCSGNRGGPVTSNDAHWNSSVWGWESQLSSFKCEVM